MSSGSNKRCMASPLYCVNCMTDSHFIVQVAGQVNIDSSCHMIATKGCYQSEIEIMSGT